MAVPPAQLSLAARRDRALIGVMVFSFARVSAVLGMDGEDFCQRGKRCWPRLHEEGGKPLFSRLDRRGRVNGKRLERREARHDPEAGEGGGLGAEVCNHAFRATGIIVYQYNPALLGHAQAIAAHESTREAAGSARSTISWS